VAGLGPAADLERPGPHVLSLLVPDDATIELWAIDGKPSM